MQFCEMLSTEDLERIQKENKDKFVIDLQHPTLSVLRLSTCRKHKKHFSILESIEK